MGAAAGVVAPLIGGIAATGLTYLAFNSMMKGQQNSQQAQLQQLQDANSNALTELPTVPDAPTNNPDDATGDTANASEVERQKQLAAMQANDAAANPTGGLGDTSTPNVRKKQLLGA